MSENFKQGIILVALLALLGGFYFVSTNEVLFKGSQKRALEVQQETERLKKEIIIPLKKLKDVSIYTDFFLSPEYMALENNTEELGVPELQRPNPFAPVQ